MPGINIIMRTRIFTPDWSRRASEAVLDIMLDALVAVDVLWLRLNPKTPRLRESGVRYYHEGIKDEWFSIDAALHALLADCKGLAAWDVAELRTSGEDPAARTVKRFAEVKDSVLGNLLVYHVMTERGDGRIVDPSRDVGMDGAEPDGYMPVPGVAWAIANALTHTIGAGQLGDPEAVAALAEVRRRAEGGDRVHRYLLNVAKQILAQGYDARRTEFVRGPDGRFEWEYPPAGGR